MRAVTAVEVKEALARLGGGAELALVDVREHGQYGEGHPFFAVNLPYSRLELDAPRLLPSRHVPVVVLDDADGVVDRAGARLAALGYRDVRALAGGAPGWAAAGFQLFKGVNVPSKALGELAEGAFGTPHLGPAALRARVAAGDDLVILDGRTPAEFRKMSIPGARSCPNAELALRIGALAPRPDTTVVVNCAGRTRSIIGAENLRALGLPNPVLALENGTQGWQLAGFELDRGRVPAALPALSAEALAAARARARSLAERHAIPRVGLAELARWREAARTLHVLDVRTVEEFRAGHLPGSAHAPGGQLAQATDQWVAVRGARLALVDDHELRAVVTARWLRGMGHDAWVVEVGATDLTETGDPAPEVGWAAPEPLPRLGPAALAEGPVIDLSPSQDYRAAHVAGARWGCRPRLGPPPPGDDRPVVLVAPEPAMAELAAVDLRERGNAVRGFVARDVEGWRRAGVPVVSTPGEPADAECVDFLFFVHDRHAGNLDAARAYLAWETGLIDQMDAAERAAVRPR